MVQKGIHVRTLAIQWLGKKGWGVRAPLNQSLCLATHLTVIRSGAYSCSHIFALPLHVQQPLRDSFIEAGADNRALGCWDLHLRVRGPNQIEQQQYPLH